MGRRIGATPLCTNRGRHIERTQIYANGPRPVANGNHLFSDASRMPSESAPQEYRFYTTNPIGLGKCTGMPL